MAHKHPQEAPEAAPGPDVTPAPTPTPAPTTPPPKPFIRRILDASRDGDDKEIQHALADEAKALATKHAVDHYKIVVLFDDVRSISDFHADQIYNDLSGLNKAKDVLLILYSRGGKVEPAYLISKMCKRLSQSKFAAAVPRRAKSAATLVCLGADEVHLGLMSQLGPIDPQVNDLPALGMANGATKVSELVTAFPKSADMWAKYLSENLNLRYLGYLERLTESAAQYAERLLANKVLPNPWNAKTLANHLVNHYKDHAFLIDLDEASSLLGGLIKTATPEYNFANEFYQSFWLSDLFYSSRQKKELTFVGDLTPSSVGFQEQKASTAV